MLGPLHLSLCEPPSVCGPKGVAMMLTIQVRAEWPGARAQLQQPVGKGQGSWWQDRHIEANQLRQGQQEATGHF